VLLVFDFYTVTHNYKDALIVPMTVKRFKALKNLHFNKFLLLLFGKNSKITSENL